MCPATGHDVGVGWYFLVLANNRYSQESAQEIGVREAPVVKEKGGSTEAPGERTECREFVGYGATMISMPGVYFLITPV
jgi:hypothetical protein